MSTDYASLKRHYDSLRVPSETPVIIEVSPNPQSPGEWELHVSVEDASLHKLWGNPLDYEPGFTSPEEAVMNGEMFARAEGHPIARTIIYPVEEKPCQHTELTQP